MWRRLVVQVNDPLSTELSYLTWKCFFRVLRDTTFAMPCWHSQKCSIPSLPLRLVRVDPALVFIAKGFELL